MEWKKVVAIIRTDKLEGVEERLKKIRVRGISVTRGKGYGEYANFFTSDWFVTHARLEIYCEASRADDVANTITEAAHTGLAGDGIVAVIPVEKIYRIRTKAEGNAHDV
ncbi:MAG: P-II family nitrogen regulator [Deltaproteobacteria bacterium]|nr:P-II family nitrogen regulator [Deltaproteobacteria bacterium]